MSVTLTQRPNAYNNWNAGFNPVLFKGQRKDYTITAVASSAGALQITVSTNLTTLTTAKGGAVTAGSVLWVTTDNGVYNGAYTVVTCTNAASSVVTFAAGTYTSAATTGYINLQQRTGYSVKVGIYAGNGAVSTSALFYMSFTPTKSGLVTMDISQLRTYLSPELFSALSTTTNLSNAYRCKNNAFTSYKAHIQYTEVWTSSAETEVSDSANPFFIVYGAMQIPSTYGGYLKEYSDATGRKFLSRFSNPRIYSGKKFTLSFIDPSPSGTSRTYIKKSRYDAEGLFWGATYDLSDYSAGTPNPSVFENFEDGTYQYRILSDIQDAAGTISWTGLTYTGTPSASGSAGATSNGINYFANINTTHTYTIRVNVTVSGTGAVTLGVRGKQLSGTNTFTLTQSAAVGTNTYTFLGTPSTDCHIINIYATFPNTATITINSVTLESLPTDGWIDYQIVTMTSSYTVVETIVSETLRVYFAEYCEPSVQLFWKNSLGGDSSFLFPYNQESTIKINSNKKSFKSKLFSDSITSDHINGLSDLIGIGDEYDNSITEFTSSIIRSQNRIGQNVIAITSIGQIIGVVVDEVKLDYSTNNKGNFISISISYPEIFHQK